MYGTTHAKITTISRDFFDLNGKVDNNDKIDTLIASITARLLFDKISNTAGKTHPNTSYDAPSFKVKPRNET